jgi:hypothetical protein
LLCCLLWPEIARMFDSLSFWYESQFDALGRNRSISICTLSF